MIGIDAHLLTRRELQHVLLLVLVRRGRATDIAASRIGRAEDHRLAVMDAIAGSIGQTRAGGFARQLGRQEFVGGQLAVGVVLHGALADLRRVGGRVGGGRRHIGVLARIHCIELEGADGGEMGVRAGARLRMARVQEGGSWRTEEVAGKGFTG